MAVGTESGEVIIYEATVDGPGQFLERLVLDHECVIHRELLESTLILLPRASIAHVDQIHRLAWRPSHAPGSPCDLAMCAEDRSLRIIRINFS